MLYVIIGIELLLIILLVIYNIQIRKKSNEVKTTILKIKELSLTRDILNIVSSKENYQNKFKKINEYIIDTLKVDYSSIVLKESEDIDIIASNIDEARYEELKEYYKNKIFLPSVAKDEIVYFEDKKNTEDYKDIKTDIKAAMFLPITIDKIFSGYWLIETKNITDLKNQDIKTLNTIKETLAEVIKVTSYQSAFETLTKEDEFTSFKTREYLFGELKNELDGYTNSLILMVKIANLKNINKKFGRDMGNKIVSEISNKISENIDENAEAVRYFGPKLVIIYKNVDTKDKDEKEILKKLKIDELNDVLESIEMKKNFIFKVKPKFNFAYNIYEKNTRLHKNTQKLEEYIDSLDENNKGIQKV